MSAEREYVVGGFVPAVIHVMDPKRNACANCGKDLGCPPGAEAGPYYVTDRRQWETMPLLDGDTRCAK